MVSKLFLAAVALSSVAFAHDVDKQHKIVHKYGHHKKHKCHVTECVDYVNDCGLLYGGCYPACGKHYTTPKYKDPGCPSSYSSSGLASCNVPPSSNAAPTYGTGGTTGVTTGGTTTGKTTTGKTTTGKTTTAKTTAMTTGKTKTKGGEYGGGTITTPPEEGPTGGHHTSECKQATICADLINKCGQMYGGCYCPDTGTTVTVPACKKKGIPESTTVLGGPTNTKTKATMTALKKKVSTEDDDDEEEEPTTTTTGTKAKKTTA